MLCEQFEIEKNRFTANVNASKIETLFKEFINMQTEKLFFILEIPLNEQKERELLDNNVSPFHNQVYYIDGLSKEKAITLFNMYGELLIHDGISVFGFGVHDGSAEIMKYEYNVINLWAKEPERYIKFFSKFEIPATNHCVTAWETFDKNNPGDRVLVNINGITIYDLPNKLKDWGIYLAQIR